MHNLYRLSCGCLALALLSACGTMAERSSETDRRIQDSLTEGLIYEPPTDAETRDLLLPPMEPLAAQGAPEERFDIRVENARTRSFLMSLVDGTDWNMVVHPDVDGSVSLELRNVTIPDVMEVLRDMYGLEYTITENRFTVRPASLESRLYEVNYLDVKRSGTSHTRVSSGQATQSDAALQDTLGGAQQPATRGTGRDGDQDRSAGTRIETESESEFWPGLRQALENVLGGQEGRNVMVNPQAGVVSVRAMPDEHRDVAALIEAIQGSVQRQVILEAKIIEVELRDGFRSGINWTALATISGRDFGFGQVAGQNLFEERSAATRGRSVRVDPGRSPEGFDTTAFGGPFTFSADSGDFNAFIELLETQGRTQVLSSPRVATINNQKAVIKVGTDEFFVTGVVSRTAAVGAGAAAASSVELTPFFSGIALDVTPQISRNGQIILHIHPTVSEVTDQTKNFTVGGQQESLPMAFSSVRESDSIIRANDGQLVVIGGLMSDSTRQERMGTPGLGRIPGLGHLFGSRQERSTKTELVILLRPIVVGADEVWTDQVQQPLDRIRGMGGYSR